MKNLSPKIYQVLKNIVTGDIENFKVTIHDPNKKGEGFLGEIIFITLEDKSSDQIFDLVVKQASNNANVRNMCPIRYVFINEIYFYTQVWPRFNEFQQSINPVLRFQAVPKCFTINSEDNSEQIVLENLKRQNFELYKKSIPLDKEHFEIILKNYGKFHALSFAYKKLHPNDYANLVAELKQGFSEMAGKDFFYKGNVSTHKLCLESLQPGIDDAIIEKYKDYPDKCNKLFFDSINCKTKFTAVIHGDCWSNNMMFRYDETRKVTDVRFLDFQMVTEGSPCCDLSYCIYSGAPNEVLQNLDYYLGVYHNSLSETLKGFGCDPEKLYPFEELKKDWKCCCSLGFTMALMIWRMKFTFDNEIKDLEDLTEQSEEEIRSSGYDQESYKKVTRDLVLHLYENDYL